MRLVLLLAFPVLLEQLLGMLVGLVDTWLTGNFLPGDSYLAAMGLMAYLLWFIPSLFSTVAIGATALTSRLTGAGDNKSANHTTNQAFGLGCVMAFLVTVILSLYGESLVRWMRLQDDAIPLAAGYLRMIVPVVPAIMIQQVGIASLRGAGDTVTGFWTMTIVNVVNILVSTSLVIGFGPIPKLGWIGLAIGTATGHVAGAVLLLFLMTRKRSVVRLCFVEMWPDMRMAKRILKVGIPGGLDVLSILTCHLWFLSIINSLGNEQAAAHSLVIRIESLAYLPGAAFQVAATTLAGQFLGAKNKQLASQSVMVSCIVGVMVMSMAGVVFYFAGHPLASFFTGGNNEAAAIQAARVLKLAAFAMPALAISMIITGALRGAGDTRWPFVINLFGILGIRVAGGYLLTGGISLFGATWGTDFGLLGAWYAMVADLFARAALVSARFLLGGWQKIKV